MRAEGMVAAIPMHHGLGHPSMSYDRQTLIEENESRRDQLLDEINKRERRQLAGEESHDWQVPEAEPVKQQPKRSSAMSQQRMTGLGLFMQVATATILRRGRKPS
jgi:hypothetical protein